MAPDDITVEIAGGISGRSDEQILDLVAGALVSGSGVDVSHDDAADEVTISFTGTEYTAEAVRDDVAAALGGGSGITVTHDDANDTITVDTSALLDGQDFDGQGSSQFTGLQSLDTERLFLGSDGPATSFAEIGGFSGEVVKPDASSDDLDTFVSNNGGKVIDLQGQTFSPSGSLPLASDTVIRNGTITVPETTSYTNGSIVYTPSADNVTEATVQNVRFVADRELLTAVRLENTGGCRILSCSMENFGRESIEILGSIVGGEGNGYAARVHDCMIQNGGLSSTPAVTIDNDYVTVSNSSISHNNGAGIETLSDNISIIGVTSSYNGQEGVHIRNCERTKVYGCTLNHNQRAIRVIDAAEYHIEATHGKVIRSNGIEIDGGRRGTVNGVQLGKTGSQNTGDNTVGHGIVLMETNRTATGNDIVGCKLGIDESETMVDGITELNTTSGNIIKNNHVLNNTGTAYSLNSTAVADNTS